MTPVSIVPVAKALYLCDGHIGFPDQKTDLIGIFNAIRPQKYPYVHKHLVIFAQLINGLGDVPFYFDVTYAPSGKIVHTTNTNVLQFPHRQKLVQLALTMTRCRFRQPGTYLVELYCGGQWVSDTTLELQPLEEFT